MGELVTKVVRVSPAGYLNPLPILYLDSGGQKKLNSASYPTRTETPDAAHAFALPSPMVALPGGGPPRRPPDAFLLLW
jgi:hypothetical protein